MRKIILIISGAIIALLSFGVEWLIYMFSLLNRGDSSPNLSVSYISFPLTLINFIVPITLLVIITQKILSLDKYWIQSIAEGLIVSSMYLIISFLLYRFDLFFGWIMGGGWEDGYFTWMPYINQFTILNFVVIPCVVLCVRYLLRTLKL